MTIFLMTTITRGSSVKDLLLSFGRTHQTCHPAVAKQAVDEVLGCLGHCNRPFLNEA